MTPEADGSILTGVSETALLTLNGRAHQAALPDAIIDDPMAIRLRDALGAYPGVDYDKFGRKGQEMALRSLAADRCTADYLRSHPRATAVIPTTPKTTVPTVMTAADDPVHTAGISKNRLQAPMSTT